MRALMVLLLLLLTGPGVYASRNFDGSTQYFTVATAMVTGDPFTVCAWFRTEQNTTLRYIWQVGVSTTTANQYYLYYDGTAANDPAAFGARAASSSNVLSGGSSTLNTWYVACGQEVTETNRNAYLNNQGNATPSTTSRVPAGMNQTRIAQRATSTPLAADIFDGDIAHVTIWNVALSVTTEMQALANGVNPTCIRPLSIVSYVPLWGIHDPEIDARVGRSWTATGSPTRGNGGPPVGRPCW